MVDRYFSGDNLLLDISLSALSLSHGLGEIGVKKYINENVRDLVFFELEDKKWINYLDFNIKIDKFGDYLEIRANNIVSALWFINEWPYEPDHIMKNNEYLTENGKYIFNNKTKKLIFLNSKQENFFTKRK